MEQTTTPRPHRSGTIVASRSAWLRLLAATIAVSIAWAASGAALAHVQIDVGDGRYVMEIGFRDEPAYAGQPNALALRVQEYATGGTQPVDGLAATLSAEVSKDGQSMSLPLVPKGEGTYEGLFVPTATGDYTFHISGTIGDAQVDETVTSGPNTFNAVEPLSAIEFPPQTVATDPAAAAEAADRATADLARTLAIAGLIVGLVGLIVAAFALTRTARPRTEAAATPIDATEKLIR